MAECDVVVEAEENSNKTLTLYFEG